MGHSEKTLKLRYHGRIIDHLGIQMYQSPIAAIAELIANAWDADAENVWVSLPMVLGNGAVIVIRDDGIGMTFLDCQNRYLNVGWGRRGDNPDERSPEKNRPILGRKGIGKFAGFGIAQVIRIETVSKFTGEKTTFELDLGILRGDEYVAEDGKIPVIEYLEPSDTRKDQHGTKITLKSITLGRRPSVEQFRRSMGRRFLLHERSADFTVFVNEQPISSSVEDKLIEFVFPRDYRVEEKPKDLVAENDWGEEKLSNGRSIRWRICFYEDTIDEEELRGVSIFARGKLAQRPFFFDLAGGLGGQHGQEYLSGQVQADYVDELDADIIATERQRIRWEDPDSYPLLEWGQQRVKELLRIWRDRRGEKRRKEIEDKLEGFAARLSTFPPHEARTIKRALTKLGGISTIKRSQFEELGLAILTAWEQGRLRELMNEITQVEDLSEEKLLEILVEAEVLTALNVAEAVKTKVLAIRSLEKRLRERDLEKGVRDHIANHPWLISAAFETFRVETSLSKLINAAAEKAELKGDSWKGRVDLVLYSGNQLVILEFMRPQLKLDWDHLSRFERYILTLRANIDANTGGRFHTVTGYIVADGLEEDAAIAKKIAEMKREEMFALDWPTLLANAVAGWDEFLEALVTRSPEDDRLRGLLK